MLENSRPKPPRLFRVLSPAACCLHKSWGFGRVAEWSLLTGQIVVDFQSRKGHPMQAQYAAETLQPISAEHILARKNIRPCRRSKGKRQEDPDLTPSRNSSRSRRKSRGGSDRRGARTQIFDAPSFKKWWDLCKKKLKADGYFLLPARKSDPVVLLDTPSAPGKGFIERFRGSAPPQGSGRRA